MIQALNSEVYIKIAQDAEVFTADEINVLKEILADIRNNPQSSYVLFNGFLKDELAGFVIFGKTPMTEFSWDIYWLIVNKQSQGKGVGKDLLKQVEKHITGISQRAVIRIETSSRSEYFMAQNFYKKNGFAKTGIIPDFYKQDDDLLIFHKDVCMNK